MKKTGKKVVKAWAFLTGDGKFIPDGEREDIYLKRPKARPNPFNYGSVARTWKPTELTITYPL